MVDEAFMEQSLALNPGFSVFGWYLVACDAQRRCELSAAVKRRNSGDRQVRASARDYEASAQTPDQR
jgi:hypothetical protein